MPPAAQPGPSSLTVAANLARYRTTLGLSQVEMAKRLVDHGVQLSAPAYAAVEQGRVRVTVDLLTAAASVLGISPATLLMPYADDYEDEVTLTGADDPAGFVWSWLTADAPLTRQVSIEGQQQPSELRRWRNRAWPAWCPKPSEHGG